MSVYFDILDAVKTRLAGVAGAPAPDLRYEVELFEKEAAPLLIVAPGPDGEKIVQQTFGKGVWYAYPVLVAYVTAGNRKSAAGLQEYLGVREAIRNELFQVRLPGVSDVIDTGMGPQAVSKLAATLGGNYRVTGWLMTYKAVEQRTS